jgi:hypothetical protein
MKGGTTMDREEYRSGGPISSVAQMSGSFSLASSARRVKTLLGGDARGLFRNALGRFLNTGAQKKAHPFHIYNEAEFRYLLTNESKRTEQSGCSFLLVLLFLSGPEGGIRLVDEKSRNTFVRILSGILRETDYVGWYRADHVLAGLLTALDAHPSEEVSARIEQRFWRRIRQDCPSDHLLPLRVQFVSSKEVEFIKLIDRVVAPGQPQ